MDERVLFALLVFLIAGGYQCYWIRRASLDKRKWEAIAASGSKCKGIIKSIDHDYMRYGERLNVYVGLSIPGRGELLLRNWPVLKHCPYAVGSEAEVLWSPDFPDEFIFASEEVWVMSGLNPIINGRFSKGVFKFRFFMIWALAVALILIGFAASNYIAALPQ